MSLWFIFFVIFVALAFEYINGFHDTANSIATVVGTKVLTPRQAIFLAAVTNLIGALVGHAVAKTISSGLVDSQFISPLVIACALLGGITWNLITWWFGLPSSSTHALVGALCGAALASSDGNFKAITWSVAKFQDGKLVMEGVLHKVVIPMITSPVIGFVGGFVIMGLFYLILRSARPRFINRFFGKAQIASAAYMGFAHGLADSQKTMGIITLALVTATAAGSFHNLPSWCEFLRMENSPREEQRIERVLADAIDSAATPETYFKSAEALEEEAHQLKAGDYKEAAQSMSALLYQTHAAATASDASASAAIRMKSAAAVTHQELEKLQKSRVFPKIPLIGLMDPATATTDWEKSLASAMENAKNDGKPEIAAAAQKVKALAPKSSAPDVPVWIKVICALTMAAGTAAGGWKIIKTLGHKMVKLQPVHGFAAETTAATLLAVTGSLGMTVSTTHSITTSIMGVGCAKRMNALNFSLVERIIWAWVLTLPASAAVAWLLVKAFQLFGWLP